MSNYILDKNNLDVGECGYQSCPVKYELALGTAAVPSTDRALLKMLDLVEDEDKQHRWFGCSTGGRVIRSTKTFT